MPIISKKQKPESMTFRWDPGLLEDLRKIASLTGRSLNETAEMLMRWAAQEALRELDGQASPPASRAGK